MEQEEYIPLLGAGVEVERFMPMSKTYLVTLDEKGQFPIPETALEFYLSSTKESLHRQNKKDEERSKEFAQKLPDSVSYIERSNGKIERMYVIKENFCLLLAEEIYNEFEKLGIKNLLGGHLYGKKQDKNSQDKHSIIIKNTGLRLHVGPYHLFNAQTDYGITETFLYIMIERIGRSPIFLDFEKQVFVVSKNTAGSSYSGTEDNFTLKTTWTESSTYIEIQNQIRELVKTAAHAIAAAAHCAPLAESHRGYAKSCAGCAYQLQCVTKV